MKADAIADYFKSDRSGRLSLGLISFLLILIYGRTVFFDFNVMDDADYILKNPFVYGGLSLDSIVWAFTPKNLDPNSYYMPVSWLSLMADASIWGTNPTGYHLTNLLLFVGNALLLYLFLAKMLGRHDLPLLAALLFAFHPMRVESVVWIAQRKDLLSGCFLLLSLLAYFSCRATGKGVWLAASLAAFLLGILSKPNIVMLPLLLVLIEYQFPLSADGGASKRKMPCLALAPFFALSAAAVFYALYTSGGLRIELPVNYRFFTMAHAHLYYLSKTFLPFNLFLSESHFQFAQVSPPLAVAVLVVLAAATALVFAYRDKARLLFFGWFWFLISLGPVNGFVPTGNVIWSDKFTFIPHMGLALILAAALCALRRHSPRLALTAASAALAILAALTFSYSGKWENTYTICMNTIERGGPPGFGYTFMAAVQLMNGNTREAIALLDKAEAADPNYHLLYYDRGRIYQEMGRLTPALRDFEKAIQLFPQDYMAMRQLAEIYDSLGDAQAAEHYRAMAEGKASR